ncbi:AmmeMemoRadiSam system protein B [Candidatus Woesearchaeota archaeon]|nr:AmmeMemoRadiSam system protein B [Candidatus Woesearchaeota archaeon]MBW3005162.1 AmmeMemoRadiSam system protein B [Candidatus Woesearchaeota archaeon]
MRNPVVSGAFYPDNAESLKQSIKDCFLSDFGPGKLPEKREKSIKGVIVPHAGYVYSGPCAAYCYKEISESHSPDIFIILGLSHSGFPSCLSLEDWRTPLGTASVDKDFGKLLIENGILQDEQAHANEHSIEVQIPFLQFILKDFKFVPIIVSEDYKQVAGAILKALKQSNKKAVIIASSDFTHYGADYGFAPFTEDIKEKMHKLDAGAIKQIKKLDAKGFLDYIDKTGATICGRYPIACLLECIKPAKAELLKYYTSADISKSDYSVSVGYAAILFS